MKENSPYPIESFNNQLIEMMLDHRKIEFEATEYNALIEIMADEYPEQYEDTEIFGDSSDAFYQVSELLLQGENEIIQQAYEDECRKQKRMHVDLSNDEIFLKSPLFKSFGFRMLQTNRCLTCKSVTRNVQIHLDLKLPVKFDKSLKLLQAQDCIKIFNPKNYNRFWNNPLLSCLCCTSKPSEVVRPEEDYDEQSQFATESNQLHDFSIYRSNNLSNQINASLKKGGVITNSRRIYLGKTPTQPEPILKTNETEETLTKHDRFKVINTMKPLKDEKEEDKLVGSWPEYEGPVDDDKPFNAFRYEHTRKFLRLDGLGDEFESVATMTGINSTYEEDLLGQKIS